MFCFFLNNWQKPSLERKTQAPNGFSEEFPQVVREEIILILYKLFRKMEEKGVLHNSLPWDSIFLTAKTDIYYKKQKLQVNSTHVH